MQNRHALAVYRRWKDTWMRWNTATSGIFQKVVWLFQSRIQWVKAFQSVTPTLPILDPEKRKNSRTIPDHDHRCDCDQRPTCPLKYPWTLYWVFLQIVMRHTIVQSTLMYTWIHSCSGIWLPGCGSLLRCRIGFYKYARFVNYLIGSWHDGLSIRPSGDML